MQLDLIASTLAMGINITPVIFAVDVSKAQCNFTQLRTLQFLVRAQHVVRFTHTGMFLQLVATVEASIKTTLT